MRKTTVRIVAALLFPAALHAQGVRVRELFRLRAGE